MPAFIDLGGIVVPSTTELINIGKLVIDTSTPITCAHIADFGVHATVVFDDGGTACAVGGNATEAAAFTCR